MIGKVMWITGLSGAGKTTVAEQLTLRIGEGGLAPALLLKWADGIYCKIQRDSRVV